MSTYPDLTAGPAERVEDLLTHARTDLAATLEASRRRPLPPSPACSVEPASAVLLLARYAPPPQNDDGPSGGTRGASATGAAVHAAPREALHELGVADLLDGFAAGAFTPSQVLAALRPRWRFDGPGPGAVLAEIDGADAAAADADQRWRAGTARPLEGVPFGVKDIIDVAGAPVTCGSATTGDRVATVDAEVVARLRAVGAIPVVMTATTEFACGAPTGARYGAVGNPWDPRRWTGGSSTGSAAALAARLVPLALGTDTGGSIRVPSALCHLTGLKPTYGLVPRTGVASLSFTLDHVGPMARDARDLALVLPHLAGPDGADPTSAPATVAPALARDVSRLLGPEPVPPQDVPPRDVPPEDVLAGLRVGLPREWFTDLCDARVLAAWHEAAQALARLGADVVPADVPDAAAMHDDVVEVLTCELASAQEASLPSFAAFDIGTQVRIARGLVPSAVDYLRAVRRRALAQQQVLTVWDDAGIDVLLTPGVGGVAPTLADVTLDIDGVAHPMQAVINRNTALFDYLGFPALMMPAGLVDGLPVGVQVVGRPWAEALCLRVALAFQADPTSGVHHRRAPAALARAG